MHEGRPRRQRLLDGGHRGQWLVVDVDQVESFSGRGVILGDHRCYRLSLVAGHLYGEDGTITERRTEVGLTPAEVLAGDHGVHAADGLGSRDIHAPEARVRIRRAQELGMKHSRQDEIRHVADPPRDLLEGIEATHRLPDDAKSSVAHLRGPSLAAQSAMASMILR